MVMLLVLGLAACGSQNNTENLPVYSQGLTADGYYDVKASDFITLPEYKGIVIPEEYKTVEDSEVLEELDGLTEYYEYTVEIKDRAVADGDQVNIAYVGTIDGEAFDGGTSTGTTVTIGVTNYVDGFLDQLVGHMPGEEVKVEVTFPEDYKDEKVAGKDAVFDTTINYIVGYETPELTDDFIKEHFEADYGVKTVAEMEEYIRQSMIDSSIRGYVDEYLMENIKYDTLPDSVIEHQKLITKANIEQQAAMYGMTADLLVYYYYGVESVDALFEQSPENFEVMAADLLMYQAIAEKEGIKVKNTDVADYMEELSGSREYEDYRNAYGMPYLKLMTMTDKALNVVLDNAK